MFDFSFDASTKKTAGQIAVGSGVALLVFNKFERPNAAMGLPLALIGGGMVVLALTASEPSHEISQKIPEAHGYIVSGPQEDADKKALDLNAKWAAIGPWLGLGAIVGTGLLVYARAMG